MDPDLARRFSGLERLYGVPGAAAIRAAHVMVIGIGGVGSWAAEALARSGVGRITRTVGMAKVDAMQARIAQINPQCTVHCVEEFATPDNWHPMVAKAEEQGGLTAVVDACDQVKTKVALAAWAWAQSLAKPKLTTAPLFITVGAAGGKRRADKVDIADLSETTHDPLLAQVRYRLRREHAAPRDKRIGIHCVFSRESVAPPDPSCAIAEEGDGSLNCHGYGSVVAVTAAFGMCAAGWVLDEIAKK
jgi:tRNA threonylcarbamoyladenosine dehydratase